MNFKDMIKEFNRKNLEDANAWRKNYFPHLRREELSEKPTQTPQKTEKEELVKEIENWHPDKIMDYPGFNGIPVQKFFQDTYIGVQTTIQFGKTVLF